MNTVQKKSIMRSNAHISAKKSQKDVKIHTNSTLILVTIML